MARPQSLSSWCSEPSDDHREKRRDSRAADVKPEDGRSERLCNLDNDDEDFPFSKGLKARELFVGFKMPPMEKCNGRGNFVSLSEDATVNMNLFVVDDEYLEDDEIEIENSPCLNDDSVEEPNELAPEVGMKFKELDEVFEFYKNYASNWIFQLENPTIQTGCKARVTVVSDARGSWRLTKVQLDHNHKTSPSKSRLYRCNRQLSENVKRKLEVNDIAGIPLHKSYNSAVVEAGGYEQMTFIEKDCRNYIDKVRRLRLGEGDAEALRCYFSKMQS
ncbi:Protein FAR1-RELATED SEQUENCE [Abeliophyllum distichum]|uniref:Protein FAR1-RELATED SEQUENCE n=1 Tax=Abeliophyllum distichum TaxID=126358 RepID=A0ABD1UPU5_9LAMI